MPAKYASNTEVAIDRSRQEIEKELVRFGAEGFSYGWQGARAMIEFIYHNKRVRFLLELPARETFNKPPPKTRGWNSRRADESWEQAKRQRWRSLALIVKAKLVAVTDGIKTFEHEFGLDIVLPDGQTVAEHVLPKIEESYRIGVTPQLLLPPAPTKETPSNE